MYSKVILELTCELRIELKFDVGSELHFLGEITSYLIYSKVSWTPETTVPEIKSGRK